MFLTVEPSLQPPHPPLFKEVRHLYLDIVIEMVKCTKTERFMGSNIYRLKRMPTPLILGKKSFKR